MNNSIQSEHLVLSLPWSLADDEDGDKQAASKNAQEFDHCQESTRSISKEARLGIDGHYSISETLPEIFRQNEVLHF